jgi:hypothetical protein
MTPSVDQIISEAIQNVTEVDNSTTKIIEHIVEHGEHGEGSQHALFIRVLLMLSLILISMNVNGLLHKIKFHYVSETAVTILLGETYNIYIADSV